MTKEKRFTPINIILLALIILGIAGSAYYLGLRSNQSVAKQTNITQQKNPSEKRYVNFLGNDYFRGQVMAPNDYYATNDDMVTTYTSQGGSAPPRVIFMKNYQVLDDGTGRGNYYNEVTSKAKNDCIAVWSTNGFTSIYDWIDQKYKGTLTNKEEVRVGNRKATVYKLAADYESIYVALLPIGNADETNYYFNTCNTNNKSDFITVIKSLKLRNDLDY